MRWRRNRRADGRCGTRIGSAGRRVMSAQSATRRVCDQMKPLLGLALLLAALTASAHPPVGIVADARGNIYYSDLAQVWRLSPDGSRTVVVPQVHTHELVLDAAGN